MDLGLRGRVGLVGGASRGLGLAISQRLAVEGADLVMVSRDAVALAEAKAAVAEVSDARILTVAADLSKRSDIDRVWDCVSAEFGAVDILVHNTGGPPPGSFMEHEDQAWDAAYRGLLLSVVRLCRVVLPSMQASGWGRIVVNTSFTVKEPAPRLILSNVFRTGVVALAKTLSREVGADGVTVNCVCPGAFDTERLRSIFEMQAASTGKTAADVQKTWEDQIPIGRILQPKELAAVVAFLVSELASGITGMSFPVEGGMLHGLF